MSWPKRLQVDKRIVPLLSKATYENFPRALRELISNAYDADATRTTIKISKDYKSITIEDNGNGMTPDQFDFYLRIAGRQRGKRESPKFQRKRIGQFGVGFLAVFPFTRTLEIVSTAENSDIIFEASIPTADFMRQEKLIEDVENIEIVGSEKRDPSQRDKHYTIIRLTETTDLVSKYMNTRSSNISRTSIYSWEGIDRLQWELEEILPLEFNKDSTFKKILQYREPISMDVLLNGKQLFRHDPVGEIAETHEGQKNKIGDISFKYAITANDKPIHPIEARGLKVRVNNVGVGQRTYFDLNVVGKTFRNLLWLSGEIHILDGLDETIALNRDQITWSSDYEEFCEYFRKRLSLHAEKINAVLNATNAIESVVESKITSPVRSKNEIITKNIDVLKKKGYEVKFQEAGRGDSRKAVQINSQKKEVTVFKSKSTTINDTVSLVGKRRNIIYTEWDYRNDKFPACRFTASKKAIEVNVDYPLFKSKRYGEVFKRLCLLLLIAREETNKSDDMFDTVIENLLKDFKELL